MGKSEFIAELRKIASQTYTDFPISSIISLADSFVCGRCAENSKMEHRGYDYVLNTLKACNIDVSLGPEELYARVKAALLGGKYYSYNTFKQTMGREIRSTIINRSAARDFSKIFDSNFVFEVGAIARKYQTYNPFPVAGFSTATMQYVQAALTYFFLLLDFITTRLAEIDDEITLLSIRDGLQKGGTFKNIKLQVEPADKTQPIIAEEITSNYYLERMSAYLFDEFVNRELRDTELAICKTKRMALRTCKKHLRRYLVNSLYTKLPESDKRPARWWMFGLLYVVGVLTPPEEFNFDRLPNRQVQNWNKATWRAQIQNVLQWDDKEWMRRIAFADSRETELYGATGVKLDVNTVSRNRDSMRKTIEQDARNAKAKIINWSEEQHLEFQSYLHCALDANPAPWSYSFKDLTKFDKFYFA